MSMNVPEELLEINVYQTTTHQRSRAGGSQQKDVLNLCQVVQPHSKSMKHKFKQNISFSIYQMKMLINSEAAEYLVVYRCFVFVIERSVISFLPTFLVWLSLKIKPLPSRPASLKINERQIEKFGFCYLSWQEFGKTVSHILLLAILLDIFPQEHSLHYAQSLGFHVYRGYFISINQMYPPPNTQEGVIFIYSF